LQSITALQSFFAQQGVRDTTDTLRFDTQLAARLATAATLSFASPSLIAALTVSSEEPFACVDHAPESVLVETRASCWFEWLCFAADAEPSALVDELVVVAGAQPQQPTDSHPRADTSTLATVATSTGSTTPSLHRSRIPQNDAWVLVSDWIPCPIGTVPRSLASPVSSSALMMTMPGASPPAASFPSEPTRRAQTQQQQQQQQHSSQQQHPRNVATDRQQRDDAETATKRRRLDSEHIAVELL
jgi:hypothetical protein